MKFGLSALFLFTVLCVATSPAEAGFRYVATGSAPAAVSDIVVEGFADQVPLTVALRQVLPRGMVYSIADDVDMSTKVSWQGGRPWRDVLSASLARVGLNAGYNGNTVRVTRSATAPTTTATSPYGAEAPIKLQPPVVLTPPAGYNDAPVALAPSPNVVAQGEVTSLNPDAQMGSVPSGSMALGTTPPSRPLNSPMNGGGFAVAEQFNGQPKITQLGEITSMDADIKAEVAAGVTGPAKPVVTMMDAGAVPAGATPATMGANGAPTIGVLGTLGTLDAGDSTLAPLPVIAGTETTPAPTAGGIGLGAADTWHAKPGQMMHDVVIEWAARAGIEVNWQAEYDYPIQASVNFTGTFEEAVRMLLYGFRDAQPQPVGRLHKNTELGQQVLVISVRGKSGGE